MRTLFTCAVLAIMLAAPARGGVIRGTVQITHAATKTSAPANAYPGRASALPGGSKTVRGLPSDAVVYIASSPAEAETVFAGWHHPAPKLAQKDQAFVPRVVAVAKGTQVDFPNLDPIYHNVFSLSPTKRFDLGKYPRGHSRTVTFPKPGLVNVYCDIHSDMEAFLLVLPHRGFTQPAANGAFEFPELPAGNYRVTLWHPDAEGETRDVVVPKSGTVTCDFAR